MKSILRKAAVAILLAACLALASACQVKWPYDDINLSDYVVLGEYKGITVQAPDTTVSDEDLNKEINTILADYATKTVVTDRAVQEGDLVNIDYTGTQDGVEFQGGSATDYDLTIGSGKLIAGFEDGLIGAKTGDTVTLNLTFPNPYPANTALAGAAVVFTVTVNSITQLDLPELNDAFVKEHTSFQNVDEYKQSLRESLEDEKADSSDNTDTSLVWSAVVANCTILQLPEDRVNEYYTNQVNYYTTYASQEGMTLDDYLTSNMGMSREQFDAYCTNYAQSVVKEELIAFAIAEAENIKITNSEYKQYVQYYAEQNSFDTVADFEEAYGKEAIRTSMLTSKVMSFLVDNAIINK